MMALNFRLFFAWQCDLFLDFLIFLIIFFITSWNFTAFTAIFALIIARNCCYGRGHIWWPSKCHVRFYWTSFVKWTDLAQKLYDFTDLWDYTKNLIVLIIHHMAIKCNHIITNFIQIVAKLIEEFFDALHLLNNIFFLINQFFITVHSLELLQKYTNRSFEFSLDACLIIFLGQLGVLVWRSKLLSERLCSFVIKLKFYLSRLRKSYYRLRMTPLSLEFGFKDRFTG